MALIKCPECGNQVSDKATACPNCGCPIIKEDETQYNANLSQQPVYYNENSSGNRNKWFYGFIALLFVALIGGWAYYGHTHQPQEGAKEPGKEEYKDSVEAEMTDNIVELSPKFINAIKKYEDIGEFSDGYAAVSKGHKWGYINTKGEVAIPVTIDADCVGKFSEGLAVVIPNSSDNFYVIDSKGKTVFKGKNMHGIWDTHIPYYIDGKMYVPTDDNGYKYRIYDKKGNITGTVDSEVGDNYYKNHQIGDYTIFSMTHDRYDEIDSYQRDETYGLKDISGKIVIAADYDDMQGHREGTIKISNGVVLVALTEYDENYDGGEDGHTIYHYGYADLKGKDTFTAEQKRRWRQSKIDAMKSFDEEGIGTNEYDNNSASNEHYGSDSGSSSAAPQWVQGTWTHDVTAPMVGVVASYRVEINGNTLTFYRNGEFKYRDNITYQNGRLVGQHGSFILKESLQRLADETGSYNKIDGYGSNSTGIRFSTAHDVIGYLSGRTFRDIDGGGSLQIRQEGVYVNGQCMTGAPRVSRFSSTNAIVQASFVPGGTITFIVDAQNGTISDSMGNTYR